MREKRRPTLEELKEMPMELWRLEAMQIKCDALELGQWRTVEEADELFFDNDITPEKVAALREKLGCVARDDQIQAVEASVAI